MLTMIAASVKYILG